MADIETRAAIEAVKGALLTVTEMIETDRRPRKKETTRTRFGGLSLRQPVFIGVLTTNKQSQNF